jgi:hypothetical protein
MSLVSTALRSLDRETTRSQCREWMGSAHFTGTLLSYGLLGRLRA